MKLVNDFEGSKERITKEVIELCEKGISLDLEQLKKKKRRSFEKALPEDNKYAALYAKCISVMKSQLYSPEGNIKRKLFFLLMEYFSPKYDSKVVFRLFRHVSHIVSP